MCTEFVVFMATFKCFFAVNQLEHIGKANIGHGFGFFEAGRIALVFGVVFQQFFDQVVKAVALFHYRGGIARFARVLNVFDALINANQILRHLATCIP